MERNLFSLLVTGLLFSVAVLGWNQPARAALCGKCRDLMFIDSQGKCIDCGGPTASGALQLCPKCSAKRHQCEHCLAATTEKDETPAEGKPADPPPETPHSGDSQDKPPLAWTAPTNGGNPARPNETPAPPAGPDISPPPAARVETPAPLDTVPAGKPPAELPPNVVASAKPKPINPAKAGAYVSGKWRYQLQITGPDTRTEGRWGWLTYDGQKLPRGEVNDYYNTPWGPIYWVDVPTTAWGVHGWMPAPRPGVPGAPQNRRPGRALAAPRAMSAAAPAQPATAAPTSPPAQMLEINKSHNGQLARLRVGHILVIRLPGNPASGYQWQAAKTNSTALRLTVRPQYSPSPSSTTPSTSGTYTFTFQAVQPGSGSIRLYYVRPNDPSRPRDSFMVGVNVSPAIAAATARPVATPASLPGR